MPTLNFGALEGYLKGFIDLVFEHQGRYFILDWKSNHLGYTAADYGDTAVASAMADHGYHLQYLLYAIALHRYLELRVPGYRYETHFGGVLYLFVRGSGQPGRPPAVCSSTGPNPTRCARSTTCSARRAPRTDSMIDGTGRTPPDERLAAAFAQHIARWAQEQGAAPDAQELVARAARCVSPRDVRRP